MTPCKTPKRTKEDLLPIAIEVIVKIGPYSSAAVNGETRILLTHVAAFVSRLKQLDIMRQDDQLRFVPTLDELLDQVVCL